MEGVYAYTLRMHDEGESMAVSTARSVGLYHIFHYSINQGLCGWKIGCIQDLKQISALDFKQSNLQVQYSADMLKGTRGFLVFIPRDRYRRSPSPELTICKWMDVRLMLI